MTHNVHDRVKRQAGSTIYSTTNLEPSCIYITAERGVFQLNQQGAACYQTCMNNNLEALWGLLPVGHGVTRGGEVGGGWGENSSPVCREESADLSGGVRVEQAVSKDARRLH